MAVKFANLASTTLSSAITNSATSIAVADASLFPTLGSGDYFYATIGEGSGSEIVKVTAISSNTLTVTRAQDGTTASAFSSGETIALRVVAAALDDIASQAQSAADTESVSIDGDTMTGNLSFGDNNKVILGAGNDLEIFSNGSTALLKAGNATSDIRIESDNRLVVCDRGFNEAFAVFNDDGDVKLYNNGTQRLATTSTGIDVTGIIKASGNGKLQIEDDVEGSTFEFNVGGSGALEIYDGSTERMRIDSSGNLLVGTTDTDTQNNNAGSTADNGFAYNIGSGGYLNVARYGGTVAYFNRTSTDGAIVGFRKDGSTVGSIGTTSGRLYIGDGDVALRFADDLDFIAPWNASTNAARTDAISLGNSGNKFKDLYLSGNISGASGHVSGKFAVKSTGVHASYDFYNNGTSYFNGDTEVNAELKVSSSSAYITHLNYQDNGQNFISQATSGGLTQFRNSNGSLMEIAASGNVTIANDLTVSGNLTVSGDTITANVGTLDVEDKNITLNYSTGDSSATANGAGITIQDAVNGSTDATILWDASSDRFEFSNGVDVENGGAVRVYRSGNSAYGELRFDTGENLDLFSSWGNKYLRLTRDGHLQLSGTTRIEHNGNATLGTINSSGRHTITGGATGDILLKMGSSTQTQYVDLQMASNSGVGELFKNGTAFTSYGGASSFNVYNSNGLIAFHPSNTANVLQIDTTGLNVGASRTIRMNGTTVIDASRNLTNIANLTHTGDYVQELGANSAPSSTDVFYIGGDSLASADASMYIGNRGNGSGYGWRLYYHGTGSGNNNDFSIQSENLGSPVNALRFKQDGSATFSGTLSSGVITATGNIKSSGVAHPEFELIPNGSVGNADIRFDGTSLDIRSNSSSAYLTLQTATTERLKITNTGNFEFNGGNFSEVGTISSSGKLTINNSNYANHLELVRGSDTLYLTPSGGQLITNGGLSPDVTNTDDLGRSDKYWQDLWLGTSLKMGGTTVIDDQGHIFLNELGTATSASNQYNSSSLFIYASGWDVNNSVARTVGWKIRNIPTASNYPDHDLQFVESDQGSDYIKFQLHGRGSNNHTDPRAGTFFGNLHVEAGSGTNAGDGSLTVAGSIGAGGAADSSYDLKVYGLARFQGVANFTNNVQVGGTTVINSSRNLTNIGTISSGAITASNTASGSTTQIASLVNPVGTANTGVRLWMSGTNTTTRGTYIEAVAESTSNNHTLRFATSTGGASPTERMRLDDNGRLIVGGQSANADDAVTLNGGGYIYAHRASGVSGYFDRDSNGSNVAFRYQGSDVGTIGIEGGDSLYIQAGTTSGSGLLFHPTGAKILPVRNGASVDGLIDLGQDNRRYKDLYLGGDQYMAVGKKLYFGGGSHTYISEDIDDRMRIFVGGAEFIRLTESGSDEVNIMKPTTLSSGTFSVLGGNINIRNNTAGDGTTIRDITFMTTAAQGTDDRVAIIRASNQGGSSTTRGGALTLYTRKANDAGFNATTIDNVGNFGLASNAYISFGDTNTKVEEGSGNSVRAVTNSGYIEIGPQSTSHAHIQTDRSNFYFNKMLYVNSGIVSSYDEDLYLRRTNSSDDQIQIASGQIYAGQPLEIKHEGGANATTGGRFLHAAYNGVHRLGVFSSQYSSGNLMIANGLAWDSGANQIVSTFSNFSDVRTGVQINRGAIIFTGTQTATNTQVDTVLSPVDTFNHSTQTGQTRIGSSTGTLNSFLEIKKADNNVSDHLQFFLGSTRMGEIGAQDTSWLRINQVTNKNIYTPRYIRADNGFRVDGSSLGIMGEGTYRAPDGSSGTAAISFSSDTDLGLFRYGSDVLGITAGGTRRARFGSTIFLESNDVRINQYLYHNGDTNTYLNFTGDRIRFFAGGVEMLDMVEGATDYVDIIDRVRVTAGGNLECEGNITAYSTTSISDINQKENIEVINNPIEKIKQISGYTFDWKNSGEHSGGVIAQEIEKVMPSIIKETSIRESETMKAVDYQAIIGLLVETVKDLNKRIEELENGDNEDD